MQDLKNVENVQNDISCWSDDENELLSDQRENKKMKQKLFSYDSSTT